MIISALRTREYKNETPNENEDNIKGCFSNIETLEINIKNYVSNEYQILKKWYKNVI